MTPMPYHEELMPLEEPRRKTGIAALPASADGIEYGVSLERPLRNPEAVRMVLFNREIETGYHAVEDIAESKSLGRLRRSFDEFQDDKGVRVQQVTNDGWVMPKGRVSAFHLALKELESSSGHTKESA